MERKFKLFAMIKKTLTNQFRNVRVTFLEKKLLQNYIFWKSKIFIYDLSR